MSRKLFFGRAHARPEEELGGNLGYLNALGGPQPVSDQKSCYAIKRALPVGPNVRDPLLAPSLDSSSSDEHALVKDFFVAQR